MTDERPKFIWLIHGRNIFEGDLVTEYPNEFEFDDAPSSTAYVRADVARQREAGLREAAQIALDYLDNDWHLHASREGVTRKLAISTLRAALKETETKT